MTNIITPFMASIFDQLLLESSEKIKKHNIKKLDNNDYAICEATWERCSFPTTERAKGAIIKTLKNHISCPVGMIDVITGATQEKHANIGTYSLFLSSGFWIHSDTVLVLTPKTPK